MGGFSSGGSGGGGMGQMFAQISADVGEKGNFLVSMRQNDKAADVLMREQNNALDLQRQVYGESKANFMPYLQGGQTAYDKILSLYGMGSDKSAMGDFMSLLNNSPDYQFALSQGEKALARRQSAQGNRLSPGAYNELLQYNQGMATGQLNNVLGRYFDMAHGGFSAANALAGLGGKFSDDQTAGFLGRGDIAASEYLGVSAINDRYNQRMQDIWLGGGNSSPSKPNNRDSTYSPSNFGSPIQSTDYSTFNPGTYNWGG